MRDIFEAESTNVFISSVHSLDVALLIYLFFLSYFSSSMPKPLEFSFVPMLWMCLLSESVQIAQVQSVEAIKLLLLFQTTLSPMVCVMIMLICNPVERSLECKRNKSYFPKVQWLFTGYYSTGFAWVYLFKLKIIVLLF